MSTHVPGFQSFYIASVCISQISLQQLKGRMGKTLNVNAVTDPKQTNKKKKMYSQDSV